MAHSPRSCHYERSEESAFVNTKTTVQRKQQIPHGLKAVRDDNSKSSDIAYAAVNEAVPLQSLLLQLRKQTNTIAEVPLYPYSQDSTNSGTATSDSANSNDCSVLR
jgi:hypothetical protein